MERIIGILFIIWLLLYLLIAPVTCATRKCVGAQCWDETMTDATGSGACSGHGGVHSWEYKYWYDDPEYAEYKKTLKLIFPLPGRFE